MRETATKKHAEAASSPHGDPDSVSPLQPRPHGPVPLTWRSRIRRGLLSDSPVFRILMFGSSISMLGTRISTVAFPMLILHLSNSPLIAGFATFAAIAPSMLLYMPVGALVDRWNPKRVMFRSELCRGLAIASVTISLIIWKMGVNIWLLIFAMTAEEIFEIFSMLADRRYLTGIMKRERIDAQQASIEVRTHTAVLAGRPIGPFLFSLKPFLPFLADTLSFIASMTSLLLTRRFDEPPIATPSRPGGVRQEISQGFNWLKNDRQASITSILMAMTSMVSQALIMIFLVEAHSRQFSEFTVGLVLAASGAGGAVGSYCSKFIRITVRKFWLQIQLAAWTAAFFLLALTGGHSAFMGAATMFTLSITGAIGNVTFGAYLVRRVNNDMIATVTGIGQTAAIGACALGPVLGGYAIQNFHVNGATYILLAIAAMMTLASLLAPEAWQWTVWTGGMVCLLAHAAGQVFSSNNQTSQAPPTPPSSSGDFDIPPIHHNDGHSLAIE